MSRTPTATEDRGERFASYIAGWRRRRAQEEATDRRYRVKARREAQCAAQLLAEHYGVRRVTLFGSLLGDRFKQGSDIDLAVEGLDPARFFRADAHLAREIGVPVDLKLLRDCPELLRDDPGLLTLAPETRRRLSSLSQLTEDIVRTWARREEVADEERRTYLESTALKLHNFYTGCERIFERIAGELNGGLPKTPDWHLRLLRTMSLEIPEVRPRILTSELVERLGEYLRFRHLVRNIYGFELEEDKLTPLVAEIEGVFRDLEEQLGKALVFLEEMAHEA